MGDEPTEAAGHQETETQSIHAWSQENADTEPVLPHRRSWKLPVALAGAAAVAAIGVAAYLGWPEHSASRVAQPAPVTHHVQAPPPKPQTKDERYLALLQQRGVRVVSPPLALNAAHFVCTSLAQGHAAPEIAQALVNSTPGTDLKTESIAVDTAQEVYCPPPGT